MNYKCNTPKTPHMCHTCGTIFSVILVFPVDLFCAGKFLGHVDACHNSEDCFRAEIVIISEMSEQD